MVVEELSPAVRLSQSPQVTCDPVFPGPRKGGPGGVPERAPEWRAAAEIGGLGV